MIGNVIAGLVGGGLLGQIVTLLMPVVMATAQSRKAIIGSIKNRAAA
jgi:hypothetical protein